MVAGADRSRPLGPGYFRKRSLVLYFRGVLAGGGDRVGTRTSGEDQCTEETRCGLTEFIDDQVTNRRKAIVSKTKEIEQAYYQDCETFGMVVKMLVEKDASLERPIQFALRQNLHELSERCVEELRQFIADYDAAAS